MRTRVDQLGHGQALTRDGRLSIPERTLAESFASWLAGYTER